MKYSIQRSLCCRKKRRLSSFSIPCGICLSALQFRSVALAFVPAPQENNNCEPPSCPRRLGPSKVLPQGRSSKATLPFSKLNNHGRDTSGDSFSTRMAAYQQQEGDEPCASKSHHNSLHEIRSQASIRDRRLFLQNMLVATTASLGLSPSSEAFEQAYPITLDFENNDTSRNVQTIRQERISVKRAKLNQSRENVLSNPLAFKTKTDVLGALTWSGALWLLSGSRSNPLVRPLANALYDTNTKKGAWVKDRNEGLFAPFPIAFSILMGIVFLVLGVFVDRALLLVADGQSSTVLQLAGVSLIGGASLELGRIASGEKMKTREDSERDDTLADEFEEFASKKLIFGQGGSVHRSEVIKSFRRYFAKYRVENNDYPLNDLEIEQLLREWNRKMGNLESMTSSGFIKNIKINTEAEIKM
mmetsp:Transcript_17191/g.32537  ORF Transcript_17191/g.32537 Transcript_17191/m.32537 type:complete len:416 (-) Transcript_17191:510-1757(-)